MKTIFKIEDGREKFYQWDLNRRICVDDDSITQVHFANAATPTAYVVSVSAGMANVPNIILQQNFDIKVYGYDKEFTKFEKTFEVEKRSKPQDYVYTETEILNYETLANKIKDIKENIPSTTGLATEEYVNEKVAAIPQPDLSNYATKEEIPDISAFQTAAQVNTAISNALNAIGVAEGRTY